MGKSKAHIDNVIPAANQINRLYNPDGISPTLTGCMGGGHTPKIAYLVYSATRAKTRASGPRFRSLDHPVFTLTTNDKHGILEIEGNVWRIRTLTPRECWRLQGRTDSEFEAAQAVNSDTQLYKQAGNSVTVPVIQAFAEELAALT